MVVIAQVTQQLEVASGKIESTFALMHSTTGPNQKKTEQDYLTFLEKQHAPAVLAIQDEFNPQIQAVTNNLKALNLPISQKDAQLTDLVNRAKERTSFLNNAKTALLEYRQTLAKHTGIYIPKALIPKDQLKTFLELSAGAESEFIDKLYEVEATGSSWFGFNLTNLKNKFNHNISFFNASDFESDLEAMDAYIAKKIKLIDTELMIDITKAVHLAQPQQSMTKGNLWELQKSHGQVNEKKTGLMTQGKQLAQQVQDLEVEKNKQLTVWEDRRAALEETKQVADLALLINKLEHGLAQVRYDGLVLTLRLDEIEQAQTLLTDTTNQLSTKNNNEALSYLNGQWAAIQKLNIHMMLKVKTNEGDRDGESIQQTITDDLKTQQAGFAQAQALVTQIKTLPQELLNKMEQQQAELVALNVNKNTIARTIERLVIANQQQTQQLEKRRSTLSILDQLDELYTAIPLRFPQLMAQDNQAISPESRVKLINELEKFKSTNTLFLASINQSDSDEVKEKFQLVKQRVDHLEKEHLKLKLSQVEQEVDILTARFPVNTETKRKSLLREINEFNQNYVAFFREIHHVQAPEIQTLWNRVNPKVLALHVKMKGIEKPGDSSQQLNQHQEFITAINQLESQYFGPELELGVFATYLQERAATFWLKDLFAEFAALTLGLFGFKSAAQERKEFIEVELRTAFDRYKENDGSVETYKSLMKVIDKGQQQFKPRAKVGDKGHELSLFNQLELFKNALDPIELSRSLIAQKTQANDTISYPVFNA